MATTSSRQTSLFGLQDWQKFYQSYAAANFQSYDYESLRKNFIDYLAQNYPETFNDYVESSEFVALLDVMAFMGQALAFRSDLNARENFMDTAERRDSVIKLANLVSYNPKRNIAAQGLVKITALSTTENITDINGVNLSNTTILWNDPANSSWQEQFNTILNASLINSQRIGRPGNTQEILNVKTDEYSINMPAGTLPVIPFQSEIDGTVMNFELVSSTSLNQSYIYELPPAPTSQFNILYRNDKLGYGSANTGFFFYFKQGTLQFQDINFPEKIQNNIQPIDIPGINETDTWLYKLNDSGIITQLWQQVESVYVGTRNSQGQSIKPIFSVTSRSNDQVTYVFSDGVFGEIPYGLFRAYVRSSNALQYTIDPSEMSGITASIQYVSRIGTVETLTFTFSLQTPSNTAQNRESIIDIKERAPARYYTQNRMVNGEDYTNFPFTLYNSIIKSKALNRTSIGVTRGLDLLDPTGKYSSINVFAADGAIYYDVAPVATTFSTLNYVNAVEFLSTTLPTLVSSIGATQYYQKYYPRYNGLVGSVGNIRWHQSTVSGTQCTGYFYFKQPDSNNPDEFIEVPTTVAQYSSTSAKYITEGAQLNFVSPTGYYFDVNNRLTTEDTGITSIWVGVQGVVGDGNNFGDGNLSTGVGPITLNKFVPGPVLDENGNITRDGAFLANVSSIIPQFDNTLSTALVAECLDLIKLNQNFALKFDNSLLVTQERWSILLPIPTQTTTSYFVTFVHSATDNSYTVNVNNVTYNFASVDQVRFTFDGDQKIYDPKSGQIISDFVALLKNNTFYNTNTPLPTDYYLNVIGQPVESNGLTNDFQVTVTSINPDTGFSFNPDFFKDVAGNLSSVTASTSVFFEKSTSSTNLLPNGFVVYRDTLFDAEKDLYAYSAETVFYCANALSIVNAVPSSLIVTVTTNGDHYLKTGDSVTITGNSNSKFNGTFIVTVDVDGGGQPVHPDQFKFTLLPTEATTTTGTGGSIGARFYQSKLVLGKLPAVYTFTDVTQYFEVQYGKNALSYQYRHNSGNTTRIDPSTTNIIDLYLVTNAYYINYMNWLNDTTGTVPLPPKPTINELQQSYGALDSYKMISDSVVLNSVTFKPLFGTKAAKNLQGTIKVIKSPTTTASDSQVRSSVLSAMNSYFTIDNWNFGDTFYFSELTAYLHVQLAGLISSVILVPADPSQKFGDLYEIQSAPDEIFVNGCTVSDITVISALTNSNMNR